MSETIIRAAQIIKNGGLVAFPTETVYGLGANAYDNEACLKIFKTKGRPADNPLIVHVLSISQAEDLAIFNENAYKLSSLWPGPLTLVLPKKNNNLAESVTAGLDTVAIRIPSHDIARALIRQSCLPIAAPSANKSGKLSPTSHLHVNENFATDDVFTIPSIGNTKYGLESTIVDLSTNTPTILRFGFITPELIEKILGIKIIIATEFSKIKAPGMMHNHYAPKTPIRINADFLLDGEIGLSFGNNCFNEIGNSPLNLSVAGDLTEAAGNLFEYLHLLDAYATKHNLTRIAIAPIPNESIGLAINDRISRAAKLKTIDN